jgi:hypothetical protein
MVVLVWWQLWGKSNVRNFSNALK